MLGSKKINNIEYEFALLDAIRYLEDKDIAAKYELIVKNINKYKDFADAESSKSENGMWDTIKSHYDDEIKRIDKKLEQCEIDLVKNEHISFKCKKIEKDKESLETQKILYQEIQDEIIKLINIYSKVRYYIDKIKEAEENMSQKTVNDLSELRDKLNSLTILDEFQI